MSKLKRIIIALIIGIAIAALTGVVIQKTSTGVYCSPDPAIDAMIDCSLEVHHRGLPFAYILMPNYQPKHGLQSIEFVLDAITWSLVVGGVIALIQRKRAKK